MGWHGNARYGPGWREFGVEVAGRQAYRVVDQHGHQWGPKCASLMEARRLSQRLAIQQEEELQAELDSATNGRRRAGN